MSLIPSTTWARTRRRKKHAVGSVTPHENAAKTPLTECKEGQESCQTVLWHMGVPFCSHRPPKSNPRMQQTEARGGRHAPGDPLGAVPSRRKEGGGGSGSGSGRSKADKLKGIKGKGMERGSVENTHVLQKQNKLCGEVRKSNPNWI